MVEVRAEPDEASRVIAASPNKVYRALLNPEGIAKWGAPQGMEGEFYAFEPREGGTFLMALIYDAPDPEHDGQMFAQSQVIEGRFLRLVPNRRVVESLSFASNDPSLKGEMTVTTTIAPEGDGTLVTMSFENAPEAIRAWEQQKGLHAALQKLADFVGR